MAESLPHPYADRTAAGRVLAQALAQYRDDPRVLVLALPRGGVPVAAPVASELGAPLDVVLVRKLGLPGRPELAMGAVAVLAGQVEVVRNDRVLGVGGVASVEFDRVLQAELTELDRRGRELRGARLAVDVGGRVVILVDDGIATGSTMRAAAEAIHRRSPAAVVAAAPLGAARTCEELAEIVDAVICPWRPEPFYAVGQGYRDFSQTSTEEARRLLSR